MGGFLAPAGTPRAIIARLNSELVKILHSPEVKAEIEKNGIEAVGNSPEEFREVIIAELARWKQIVAQTGVKME
jgi:tripartite-type tricarboxylate transporter receptor subunit TctC